MRAGRCPWPREGRGARPAALCPVPPGSAQHLCRPLDTEREGGLRESVPRPFLPRPRCSHAHCPASDPGDANSAAGHCPDHGSGHTRQAPGPNPGAFKILTGPKQTKPAYSKRQHFHPRVWQFWGSPLGNFSLSPSAARSRGGEGCADGSEAASEAASGGRTATTPSLEQWCNTSV